MSDKTDNIAKFGIVEAGTILKKNTKNKDAINVNLIIFSMFWNKKVFIKKDYQDSRNC